MAIKNLLKVTDIGLGNGETAIFPVQIFKVKEGINYNPGDPNYDLFRLAIKVSAKRLFPNFSFIDAPFNLQYYKEGDYNTEVAYMGCRTRVMGNHHDKTKEVTCGRGNLSFTSINLPRIAIQAKDMEQFYSKLDRRLDLCCRQLLHRLEIQKKKTVKNYPFLMGQGIWIDSEKLNINDSVEEVLMHGTLSVGFIGLAETLVALTGKHHGESEESRELGYEIISHMRKYMDDKSEETGLNFTLLATPAEGLSGRFIRMDKKRFGEIPGVTDRDYYTNSFHVPVYYGISAFDKIKIEAPFHALTNAGHISYVELDGDTAKNPEAFEAVIRCMKASGIGYGSVNHPVDRDPVCGYTGVIDDVCPRCGRREGEAISIEKLNELRKKYPDIPVYLDANH
jgi:ribonucleoside-triphosphate reductase